MSGGGGGGGAKGGGDAMDDVEDAGEPGDMGHEEAGDAGSLRGSSLTVMSAFESTCAWAALCVVAFFIGMQGKHSSSMSETANHSTDHKRNATDTTKEYLIFLIRLQLLFGGQTRISELENHGHSL